MPAPTGLHSLLMKAGCSPRRVMGAYDMGIGPKGRTASTSSHAGGEVADVVNVAKRKGMVLNFRRQLPRRACSRERGYGHHRRLAPGQAAREPASTDRRLPRVKMETNTPEVKTAHPSSTRVKMEK